MRSLLWLYVLCVVLAACGSKEERRDAFYRNAVKLEAEGRLSEAKVELKNVIKIDPQYAGAYVVMARCAIKEQDWRTAFGAYSRAVELDAGNAEAALGLGRLYLLAGDMAKAEEFAAKVIQLDPGSVDGVMLKAGIQVRSKNYPEAVARLNEVFAKDPANEDAILTLSVVLAQQGKAAEALATITRALERQPESRALHFRAANLAADMGDFKQAEQQLLALRKLEPANPGVPTLLASVYERMGEPARVESMLQEVLAADPGAEDPRMRLADFYMRTARPEAALEILSKAPGGMTPKQRLAIVAVKAATGRGSEAEADLAALAADPKAGPTAIDARLSLSEFKLRRGDRDGALAEIDEVLRANPKDTRGHAAKGRILLTMRRFEESAAELRIALNDTPEDAGLTVLLARGQFALNHNLSGVEVLQSFLSKKPDSAPVRLELAAHYQRQSQPDTALEVLRAGLGKDAQAPQLQLAIGDIEAQRGRAEQAMAAYRQAAMVKDIEIAALLRQGGLSATRKDWAGARQAFEEALRRNPDAHGAAEGIVAVEFDAGHPDAAATWARSRMESRPKDALAADLLGRVSLRQKNMDGAEKAFREAQARAPQWAVPTARLASLYAATKREDVAIAECRTALEKRPESVPEALLLGQLLQVKGDLAGAESTYRKLLERNPGLQPAANNLAYLIVADPQASAARLSEALNLATMASGSGDPASLDTLGWVNYRLGDKVAARANVEKAFEALPEEPAVVYHFAKLLAEEGQKAKARELLSRIVTDKAAFAELRDAKALLETL